LIIYWLEFGKNISCVLLGFVVYCIHNNRNFMNTDQTINAIKQFCKASSSDEQIWNGNKSTYHWNIGKVTSIGIVNGVVRKLAGIDVSGKQIWAVAGSLKIMPDGTIARFTGMPKKFISDIMSKVALTTAPKEVTETADVVSGI
jgi:hypothetical protein